MFHVHFIIISHQLQQTEKYSWILFHVSMVCRIQSRGTMSSLMYFPCIKQHFLLGTAVAVSPSILVETPVDSLCPHEADLARKAFEEVKRQLTTFLSDVMPGLLTLLSRFNCRKVPSPASFHIMMGKVAIIQVSHETVCSNGRDEFRRSGTVQTLLGEHWCK